jgi:hypothetical protein
MGIVECTLEEGKAPVVAVLVVSGRMLNPERSEIGIHSTA